MTGGSMFSTPALQVRQFFDEALTWLGMMGFTGVKDRSHRGIVGAYLCKFWNAVPKHDDPEQLVMNYRGWFVADPQEVRLTIERVPAHFIQDDAPPDTAAVINFQKSIPFSGLDSLAPFKAEIERYLDQT